MVVIKNAFDVLNDVSMLDNTSTIERKLLTKFTGHFNLVSQQFIKPKVYIGTRLVEVIIICDNIMGFFDGYLGTVSGLHIHGISLLGEYEYTICESKRDIELTKRHCKINKIKKNILCKYQKKKD